MEVRAYGRNKLRSVLKPASKVPKASSRAQYGVWTQIAAMDIAKMMQIAHGSAVQKLVLRSMSLAIVDWSPCFSSPSKALYWCSGSKSCHLGNIALHFSMEIR